MSDGDGYSSPRRASHGFIPQRRGQQGSLLLRVAPRPACPGLGDDVGMHRGGTRPAGGQQGWGTGFTSPVVPHCSPKQHQLRGCLGTGTPVRGKLTGWQTSCRALGRDGPCVAEPGTVASEAGGRRTVSVLVRSAQPGWVALGEEPSLHGHDSQRPAVTFTVPSACLGTSPSLEGFEGCRPRNKGFFSTRGQCPRGCWSGTVPRGGDNTAGPCAQDQHLSSARRWQVPGAASISGY